MDTRKESISTQKLCRFCLNQNDSLSSLYDRIKAPKDAVPLSLKILSCVGIEVFPSDKMPQYICHQCKFFMDLSYRFKQICRQADENILQFVQTGKTLGPVSWPAALKKVYKTMSLSKMNSNEVGVVETVTQSGDTVQVMAEEISDSEEGEDDNVYNVKVPDGPEEGKTIKVVTSDKDNGKKRSRKDSEEERPAVRPVIVTDAGCWPCDECDCTYPLEQLLTLHKTQKHRSRKLACSECNHKFFSKYDLFTHQLTHSEDMPFQCVACGKKFKRLVLLKRHEKLIHSDLPQQVCPNCPATFLSNEELEAHSQRHNPSEEKRYMCDVCDKRFHNVSKLHKHVYLVHEKKSLYSCQYCNERFPTVSKLTRHVRAHAGERPYPCKHCDKSFIKSHHYTRHLRVKHSEIPSSGAFDSEPYRCEECEESFTTQDDLMYHSALHATRNLVCPLCQEKFDDVDTVTAHIKSHVNGNQFMCDFCELIFTSKEKLDNHIARAHDEEMLAPEQELDQDETSMEMDEDEDDDNTINLKDEGDHMVVEIKKADGFMLRAQEEEEKNDNTQSEDSEVDASYDNVKPDMLERAVPKAVPALQAKVDTSGAKVEETDVNKQKAAPTPPVEKTKAEGAKETATILKKAEEIKRKVIEQQSSDKSVEKKSNNNNKVESSSTSSGPSEKSLRLLEKELQDLKRTSRNDAAKTPVKPLESIRKRPLIHTSTPKISRAADKKDVQNTKPTVDKTAPEKRTIERRSTPKEPKDTKETVKDRDSVTKDSKELKDSTTKDLKDTKDSKEKEAVVKDSKEKEAVVKETKETVVKESKEMKDSKEAKSNVKDDKEDSSKDEPSKPDKKESKDKENTKTVIKNGVNDKPPEEAVRRSTRPSKVKDYAKMIRDDQSTTDDSDLEHNDDDYHETEKSPEVSNSRGRGRKSASKPPPTPAKTAAAPQTPASLPKKRGRPRKVQTPSTPAKVRKTESSEQTNKSDTIDENDTSKADTPVIKEEDNPAASAEESTEDGTKGDQSKQMVSPTGQALKKVPIKALPPGIKPLPLPRTMGAGEVCEMQIGKKVVKVQKIVMTKAEVEAMAKKGLVEMKDGTMVLKQGIKLPDAASLKSTLVGEGDKQQESPKKD